MGAACLCPFKGVPPLKEGSCRDVRFGIAYRTTLTWRSNSRPWWKYRNHLLFFFSSSSLVVIKACTDTKPLLKPPQTLSYKSYYLWRLRRVTSTAAAFFPICITATSEMIQNRNMLQARSDPRWLQALCNLVSSSKFQDASHNQPSLASPTPTLSNNKSMNVRSDRALLGFKTLKSRYGQSQTPSFDYVGNVKNYQQWYS